MTVERRCDDAEGEADGSKVKGCRVLKWSVRGANLANHLHLHQLASKLLLIQLELTSHVEAVQSWQSRGIRYLM